MQRGGEGALDCVGGAGEGHAGLASGNCGDAETLRLCPGSDGGELVVGCSVVEANFSGVSHW